MTAFIVQFPDPPSLIQLCYLIFDSLKKESHCTEADWHGPFNCELQLKDKLPRKT